MSGSWFSGSEGVGVGKAEKEESEGVKELTGEESEREGESVGFGMEIGTILSVVVDVVRTVGSTEWEESEAGEQEDGRESAARVSSSRLVFSSLPPPTSSPPVRRERNVSRQSWTMPCPTRSVIEIGDNGKAVSSSFTVGGTSGGGGASTCTAAGDNGEEVEDGKGAFTGTSPAAAELSSGRSCSILRIGVGVVLVRVVVVVVVVFILLVLVLLLLLHVLLSLAIRGTAEEAAALNVSPHGEPVEEGTLEQGIEQEEAGEETDRVEGIEGKGGEQLMLNLESMVEAEVGGRRHTHFINPAYNFENRGSEIAFRRNACNTWESSSGPASGTGRFINSVRTSRNFSVSSLTLFNTATTS